MCMYYIIVSHHLYQLENPKGIIDITVFTEAIDLNASLFERFLEMCFHSIESQHIHFMPLVSQQWRYFRNEFLRSTYLKGSYYL